MSMEEMLEVVSSAYFFRIALERAPIWCDHLDR